MALIERTPKGRPIYGNSLFIEIEIKFLGINPNEQGPVQAVQSRSGLAGGTHLNSLGLSTLARVASAGSSFHNSVGHRSAAKNIRGYT